MTGKGFTTIELLVTVALIAILAAVAYPGYSEQISKARRAQIAGVLVEEAQKLERFHSRSGQYADLPGAEHTVSTGTDFYEIEAQRSEDVFLLIARPTGSMIEDRCGSFVLADTGRRDNLGKSGNASVGTCWGR